MLVHEKSGYRLGPNDALALRPRLSQPTLRESIDGASSDYSTVQTWDPTLGSYRAQRVSLALSKSSLSATSSDGRPSTPLSHRSSVSSYGSATSTPSSYTYSSGPRSSASILSQHSSYLSQVKARSTAPLKPVFKDLPLEIYDCILRQLRLVHETPSLQSCQTCHLRDLYSLALTSRSWDKAVAKRLYERIHIVGHDSKEQTKKYRTKIGVRLKLLRRTLRGRTVLAQQVCELAVPCLQENAKALGKDMIDVVASIVMTCPNLEKLLGFYQVYCHDFDRLTHALSTRRRLKEQMWLVGENPAITQRSYRQLPPGLMDPEQKTSFVHYHSKWLSLTTLFLHSPGQGIMEKDMFVNAKDNFDSHPQKILGPGILHRLPALKHLCISNFDMDDFDDFTLQCLPPLHSLRLQELEGVTFWGLSEFSRTRNAFTIRNLSLVNLDITYISAISNLLLHLKNLKRFALVQDTSPEVAEGEIVFQPIIASNFLQSLHWDIVVPGSANNNLVSSILANGFPRLRKIRAPIDHYGMIQALCKPRAQIEIPSDRSGKALANGVPSGGLRDARREAQQRLKNAWGTIQFKVVIEEDGIVREVLDLSGFMGTIGSKIFYSLEPDVPGSDNALIDFPALISGTAEVVGKEMCTGLWNASHHAGYKWWQHTGRPRYRAVDLEKFFYV